MSSQYCLLIIFFLAFPRYAKSDLTNKRENDESGKISGNATKMGESRPKMVFKQQPRPNTTPSPLPSTSNIGGQGRRSPIAGPSTSSSIEQRRSRIDIPFRSSPTVQLQPGIGGSRRQSPTQLVDISSRDEVLQWVKSLGLPTENNPIVGHFRMPNEDQELIITNFLSHKRINIGDVQDLRNLAEIGLRPSTFAKRTKIFGHVGQIRQALGRSRSPPGLLNTPEPRTPEQRRSLRNLAWSHLRARHYPNLPETLTVPASFNDGISKRQRHQQGRELIAKIEASQKKRFGGLAESLQLSVKHQKEIAEYYEGKNDIFYKAAGNYRQLVGREGHEDMPTDVAQGLRALYQHGYLSPKFIETRYNVPKAALFGELNSRNVRLYMQIRGNEPYGAYDITKQNIDRHLARRKEGQSPLPDKVRPPPPQRSRSAPPRSNPAATIPDPPNVTAPKGKRRKSGSRSPGAKRG